MKQTTLMRIMGGSYFEHSGRLNPIIPVPQQCIYKVRNKGTSRAAKMERKLQLLADIRSNIEGQIPQGLASPSSWTESALEFTLEQVESMIDANIAPSIGYHDGGVALYGRIMIVPEKHYDAIEISDSDDAETQLPETSQTTVAGAKRRRITIDEE